MYVYDLYFFRKIIKGRVGFEILSFMIVDFVVGVIEEYFIVWVFY